MKQAIKLVLFYFIYQIAAMFVVMAAYYGWYYFEYNSFSIQGGLPITLSLTANLIAIVIMAWQLIANKYVTINKKILNPGKPKIVITYLLLGFTAFIWMNYMSDIINLPNWFEDVFDGMKDNILGILSICVIAPIFEEMLFRGAIEGHLLKIWKNPIYAIIISSLLFGVIHGNPAQVLFAFFFGIVLGTVYYRTKSLGASIIIHFMNNTIATVLMILYPEKDTISDFFDIKIFTIIACIAFFLFLIFLKVLIKETNTICKREENKIIY